MSTAKAFRWVAFKPPWMYTLDALCPLGPAWAGEIFALAPTTAGPVLLSRYSVEIQAEHSNLQQERTSILVLQQLHLGQKALPLHILHMFADPALLCLFWKCTDHSEKTCLGGHLNISKFNSDQARIIADCRYSASLQNLLRLRDLLDIWRWAASGFHCLCPLDWAVHSSIFFGHEKDEAVDVKEEVVAPRDSFSNNKGRTTAITNDKLFEIYGSSL